MALQHDNAAPCWACCAGNNLYYVQLAIGNSAQPLERVAANGQQLEFTPFRRRVLLRGTCFAAARLLCSEPPPLPSFMPVASAALHVCTCMGVPQLACLEGAPGGLGNGPTVTECMPFAPLCSLLQMGVGLGGPAPQHQCPGAPGAHGSQWRDCARQPAGPAPGLPVYPRPVLGGECFCCAAGQMII